MRRRPKPPSRWPAFPSETAAVRVALAVLLAVINNDKRGLTTAFELEAALPTVECIQCVQSRSSTKIHLGQCKHCAVYQYMAGCLTLAPWQVKELERRRHRSELRASRLGARMLCEDLANQTTCLCNSRDRCNHIHSRLPFNTYAQLFGGVVDVEPAIAAIDPRYSSVMSGFPYAAGYFFGGDSNAAARLDGGGRTACFLTLTIGWIWRRLR